MADFTSLNFSLRPENVSILIIFHLFLVLDWREKTKWWNSQQCDINHFNLRKCFTMFSSVHADTAAGDEMTSERVSESLSVASGRGRRGLRANDVTVKLVVRFSSRF